MHAADMRVSGNRNHYFLINNLNKKITNKDLIIIKADNNEGAVILIKNKTLIKSKIDSLLLHQTEIAMSDQL